MLKNTLAYFVSGPGKKKKKFYGISTSWQPPTNISMKIALGLMGLI
jgi:hypothetical protein